MSTASTKGTSIQYISLQNFNNNLYTYSINAGRTIGTLSSVAIDAENAAERTILNYTGRKLLPGAYPGISTLMVSVRFIGSTSGQAYSGFIDPKIPSLFAPYNENAPSNVDQTLSTNLYTAGVNTTGNVMCSQLSTQGNAIVGGSLLVDGPATLYNAATIHGVTTIHSSLTVDENFNISENYTVDSATGNTVIGGTLDVSGITTVTDTTQSTNISTGAIITAGGIGVAKNAYVGGDAQVLGTVYQGSYMLVPTGAIFPFAVGTAPAGYLLCNGTAVSRTTYSVLFGVIGTTYGVGDGITTFNLPNFNGRIPIGYQSGTYDLAVAGGASTVTLTTLELPAHTHSGTTSSNGSHTHTYQDAYFAENFGGGANNVYGTSASTDTDNSFYYRTAAGGYSTSPSNINTGSDGAHTHTFTTSSSGSGSAFSIMNPFLPVAYVIKY